MSTLESFRFEDIEIGQSLRMSRTVTEEMVRLFAAATGDVNPMHLDQSFAAATPFKGCIAHGMLTAGFFSCTTSSTVIVSPARTGRSKRSSCPT